MIRAPTATLSSALLLLVLELLIPPSAIAQPEPSAAARLPAIEYVYESARIRGNRKTTERFFLALLGLDTGERVTVERLDGFRRELMATGYFRSVDTRLARGTEPESVVVEIDVDERNTILVSDVYFGVSIDTPFWGGLEVAETNLLGTGLLLAGGFVLSTDQSAVRLTVANPFEAVLPLAWSLQGYWIDGVGTGPSVDELGNSTLEAFEYQRLGGRIGVGVRRWAPFTAQVGWRFEGVELTQLDLLEPHPETGLQVGDSLISAASVTLSLAQRDHAIMPREGYRLLLSAEGSATATGSDYRFFNLIGHADYAAPVGGGQVIRMEARGGRLWSAGDAPFFEGYYIGDLTPLVASRNIGLQFTDRRTLDLFESGADLVTYGDLFGVLRGEWALPISDTTGPRNRAELYVGLGVVGIRPGPWEIGRPDAQVTSDPTTPGNGLRTDLTFDVGVRADTPVGVFGLSIGSILALLPLN